MVAQFTARISRSMVRIPGSGMEADAAPICMNLGNVSQFAAIVQVPQSVTFNNGRRPMTSSFGLGDSSTNQKLAGETTTSPATSLPNGDVIKTEDLSVESQGSLSGETVSQRTDGQDAVGRRSSFATSAVSQNVRGEVRKSGTKRPIGQESTAEDVNLPRKRYRGTPTASAQINYHQTQSTSIAPFVMSLPTGTWNSNISLSSVPVLLQAVTSNGTPLAVPLQTTNGASPAFVLQAVPTAPGGRGATLYQPAAVLMTTKPVISGPSSASSGLRPALHKMVRERDQLRRENENLKYRLFRFQQLMKNKQSLASVLRHLEAVPS